MESRVIFLVALQCMATLALDFSWKSCASADAPVHITNLQVEPSPIQLPGQMTLTLDADSSAQLSHTSIHLSVKRKTFLGEISIPCLLNIGSCTYPDVCTLIGDFETHNYAGITADLGKQIRGMLSENGLNIDQCPQPVQALHLDHQSIKLPAVPSMLTFFAAGDYHIHVSAIDTASQKEIICLDLQVTMEQACSGLSCLFG